MGVWVRCSKAKCKARRVLPKHPDDYVRLPKCKGCGGKKYLVVKRNKQLTCHCDGYWFPHRDGSKWCKYNPNYESLFLEKEEL